MLEPPDVGTVSLHLSPFDVLFRDKLRSQVDTRTKTWVTDGLFPQFAVLWLFGEVLGIIMVGTGVLMSQLLVEYVLDTSQDLDKRLWVYVLCLQIIGRNCWRNVSTLWISRFVQIFTFHIFIGQQCQHDHRIVVCMWNVCIWGVLWHCFESHVFGLWSHIQWLLAIVGTEFDSRRQWVVSQLHVLLLCNVIFSCIFLQCNSFNTFAIPSLFLYGAQGTAFFGLPTRLLLGCVRFWQWSNLNAT